METGASTEVSIPEQQTINSTQSKYQLLSLIHHNLSLSNQSTSSISFISLQYDDKLSLQLLIEKQTLDLEFEEHLSPYYILVP